MNNEIVESPESSPEFRQTDGTEVSSLYLDGQGALELDGVFTGLYTDYYLHLMQHGLRYEGAHDQLLKDALAALTLHLCSRPWDETVAWTWHLESLGVNLFVTGSNPLGEVTGRIFTEDVRVGEQNLFFSQVARPNHPARQSVIDFTSHNAFRIVEEFYRQSQQQLGRYFDLGDERISLVVAMPGADVDWIHALNAEQTAAVAEQAETRLLEKRTYRFACQCTLGRIIRALASLGSETGESLFEEDDSLIVTCPRCGAQYETTKQALRDLRDAEE